MAEAGGRPAPFATTSDSLFGGRLTLRQPVKGHRVGSDAVLLAAAAPAGMNIVDVGAGVGAVGLALLQRAAGSRAALVEIDPDTAALAGENAAANGLAERARVVLADVTSARSRRAGGLEDGKADLVVTNPPFFDAEAVRASDEESRARAHVLAPRSGEAGQSPLEAWIIGSLALLSPGGRFVMIHRPEALAAILAAFGRRLGAVALLPVHPRAEAPAHRLLISGVKSARAPMSIQPGLTLHDSTGAFTPRAEALHRGEAVIEWS